MGSDAPEARGGEGRIKSTSFSASHKSIPQEDHVSEVSCCHHCTVDPKTLVHILDHCPHDLGSRIHTWHKALERNTKYIKSSVVNRGRTLSIDSFPENVQTLLRPDNILTTDAGNSRWGYPLRRLRNELIERSQHS